MIIPRVKQIAKKLLKQGRMASFNVADIAVQSYWTRHNVTLHKNFSSPEASLEYFHWRNDQYFNYIQLMPVSGQDGKIVLDYGCGPGHDLVGFGVYSKPKRLIGIDISSSSLKEAKARLALHTIQGETIQLDPSQPALPFEDASIDHIHSSGVLHHTPDPRLILQELRRILKPGGTMNVMVYNYDSIWLHLYVAYQRTIVQDLFSNLDIRERFKRSTDGENCPISNCYRPSEWIALCNEAGFNASFVGSAISMHEAALAPLRFLAIQDQRLPTESRQFLLAIKLDDSGYPKYRDHYAGIDACYSLTKVI